MVNRVPDKVVPAGRRLGPLELIFSPSVDGELSDCLPSETGNVSDISDIGPPWFCGVAELPMGDKFLGSDE